MYKVSVLTISSKRETLSARMIFLGKSSGKTVRPEKDDFSCFEMAPGINQTIIWALLQLCYLLTLESDQRDQSSD